MGGVGVGWVDTQVHPNLGSPQPFTHALGWAEAQLPSGYDQANRAGVAAASQPRAANSDDI